MTQVIIVEDERLSAERLSHLVKKVEPSYEISAMLGSVEETIDWFRDNSPPDLIFLDIQLSDGSGIDLLGKLHTDCPVIFTTAYHEYAIKAFKFNSLDYLLKPIEIDDLKHAIEKFQQVSGDYVPRQDYVQVQKVVDGDFKKRFLVKLGDQLKSINTEEIAYFLYANGMSFLYTMNGEKWPMDHSLDQLEDLLNPIDFYRVNRQTLTSLKAISEIHTYFNSRLLLRLIPDTPEEIIVSRERVSHFKKWMDL